MSDNVIILGAGASFDAGIPLLNGFVERMFRYYQKGTNANEPLVDGDVKVFKQAVEVVNQLGSYHARVEFSDRNLEDILSILSFEEMSVEGPDRPKWNAMIRAVMRTIELACKVKHNGEVPERAENIRNYYTDFWQALFKRAVTLHSFPTIISFNYDLVLERSLFQHLNGVHYCNEPKHSSSGGRFPFDGLTLDYHYTGGPNVAFQVANHLYADDHNSNGRWGTKLVPVATDPTGKVARVELLKLHGSLNFEVRSDATTKDRSPALMVESPFLLPPIFNKLAMGNSAAEMWQTARRHLREAKNVVILGYSLPRTDIYMQYFLKAALGPNTDLNSVIVYNPVLFKDALGRSDMRKRYAECFSSQLQDRIVFEPPSHWRSRRNDPSEAETPAWFGSFRHFIEAIEQDSSLFF